jgi:hypothetical protein
MQPLLMMHDNSRGKIGSSDAGQGVGDDRHSWAYDGWRIYLWHETCAEWGARWAPGDVVRLFVFPHYGSIAL